MHIAYLERQKEKWEEEQKTKHSVTSEELTEILKEAGIETENLDDDDNDSSGFDPDATFSGPPPKRSKSETFKFVDKEWIRKLAHGLIKTGLVMLPFCNCSKRW